MNCEKGTKFIPLFLFFDPVTFVDLQLFFSVLLMCDVTIILSDTTSRVCNKEQNGLFCSFALIHLSFIHIDIHTYLPNSLHYLFIYLSISSYLSFSIYLIIYLSFTSLLAFFSSFFFSVSLPCITN